MFGLTGKYRIVVQDEIGLWAVKIYIIEDRGDKPYMARLVDGHLEFSELIAGSTNVPATLTLNRDIWELMKFQLIDTKVKDKSRVEGELEATQYHLEDLRTLLKLKTNYVISGQETKKEGR